MKHHTSQRKQNHIPITFNLLCWFINFTVQAPTIKITLCHHRWRYAQLHLNFLLNYMTGSHPDWRQQLHVGLLEAGAGSALDRRKPPVVQQSVHHRYVVTGYVWASDEIFVFSRWDIELFYYPVWSWRVLTENIHLFMQLWLQMFALCQLTCAFCVKRGGGPLPGGGHTAAEV